MNCLEFRRLKLAVPRALPREALDHLSECEACAEFARSADQFEAELESAIKVPVEPTLAQRVILNHKLSAGRRARALAIAAGVLLAVALGLTAGYRALAPDPDLITASVDHVTGEPSAFRARQSVADGELEQALALSGARLRAGFAQVVTYLHDCPVPGGLGKHLVLATNLGKVTVITMPNQRVRWSLKSPYKGLYAVIRPAQRGSFAVVAESEQALAAAETLLQQHIAWRS